MFTISSDGSAFQDNIDITLLLKAIPNNIIKTQISEVKKFNFQIMQDAIIAFKNQERMQSFEFYDKKNKTRVLNVRNLIVN